MKRYTQVLSLAGALVLGMALHAFAQEKQPHMHNALEALERSINQLELADPDKGGHREKALQLAKDALAEVRAGIEYDRQHEKEERHEKH